MYTKMSLKVLLCLSAPFCRQTNDQTLLSYAWVDHFDGWSKRTSQFIGSKRPSTDLDVSIQWMRHRCKWVWLYMRRGNRIVLGTHLRTSSNIISTRPLLTVYLLESPPSAHRLPSTFRRSSPSTITITFNEAMMSARSSSPPSSSPLSPPSSSPLSRHSVDAQSTLSWRSVDIPDQHHVTIVSVSTPLITRRLYRISIDLTPAIIIMAHHPKWLHNVKNKKEGGNTNTTINHQYQQHLNSIATNRLNPC